MTIIAWDGSTLAADRQGSRGDLAHPTAKLIKLAGKRGPVALANTGHATVGELLFRWWQAGADPRKWPEEQKTDRWSTLVVATAEGCVFYNQDCVPIKAMEKFDAWGAGRDYALGAMIMGANAMQAVQVASNFDVWCGFGCDYVKVR